MVRRISCRLDSWGVMGGSDPDPSGLPFRLPEPVDVYLERTKPVRETPLIRRHAPRRLKHDFAVARTLGKPTEAHFNRLALALARDDEDLVPHLAHAELDPDRARVGLHG